MIELYVLLASSNSPTKYNVYVGDYNTTQKGLYAGSNFNVGDLVLAEIPFIKVPTFSTNASLLETESLLEKVIQNCTSQQRKLFYELNDKYASIDESIQPTVLGIIETNGLPMGEAKNGVLPKYAGMYQLMCRMNHSCIPNVHHQYNILLQRHEIRCIKPIKKNEEIVANYFYVAGKTLLERHTLQKAKWNFKCACNRCCQEDQNKHIKVQNDAFEDKLNKLDQEITFFASFKPEKGMNKCLERIELLSCADRFYDPIEKVRTYFDAFQICIKCPELAWKAPNFIAKAYYNSVICRGVMHEQSIKLEGYCLDPVSILDAKQKLYSKNIRDSFKTENRTLIERIKFRYADF